MNRIETAPLSSEDASTNAKPSLTTVTNPLDDHLGYQLRRASSSLMGVLAQRLAQIDLTPSEASVMILIAGNDRIIQSEIGRILGIQRANMVPLTASLERRHLIEREHIGGKSFGLTVTADGRRAAAEAEQVMLEHEREFFGALPSRSRKLLLDLLGPFWKKGE
ncbi:DNA-binding MarR family transcriptional regulator [Rhizobium skierniewicense]|uniref:DNA-binding MarR family transcriptional regulator n=1 Tax=Rhizobium skierniewicense TaxID=984260 RepID=A0A7W6G129_9HYPH|nr:MarR family transcriptional regulator [Rhizobium skierniewicense]MBB3945290.1 DNA-binding MarR family transcriptional regulator [Rhizobium skierniewicense]